MCNGACCKIVLNLYVNNVALSSGKQKKYKTNLERLRPLNKVGAHFGDLICYIVVSIPLLQEYLSGRYSSHR